MKLSVLTPSFNSVRYIERAIQSVLNQDYKNWEHIIVDGGSTDGTVDILKGHSHLRWISESDMGQSDAMNKAFERATGDLIVYLNADDELDEGLFGYVVGLFIQDPSIEMVVGNFRIHDSGEIVLRKPSVQLQTILQPWPARFPGNPVAYIYKKDLQQRIGKFPIDNHYAMDYWFILRAVLFARIKRVDHVFGNFHVSGENKSANRERARKELTKVRNEFLRRFFYHPAVIAYLVKGPLAALRNI